MENFFTPEVIWFLIGLALLLMELALPGLIVFFFGVGAWVTAAVCLFLPVGLNVQLLIFLGSSLLTLVLLRRAILRRRYSSRTQSETGDLEDDYIGRTATALEDFDATGQGRVQFKGSTWAAISTAPVLRGQQVVITAFHSIRLQVEPTPATIL